MRNNVRILKGEPTIVVLAEQQLDQAGILEMARWVKEHRPHCVPERGFEDIWDLLPHDRYDRPHSEGIKGTDNQILSNNEVLVEIAGRKCYDSFADAAGKKTNREYMEHIFSMDIIHSSILYHAKMTFFFAGVSRKFSHQFIRNYVGSDRDEEGSPSQESTRFTHHYGVYVAPPYITGMDGSGVTMDEEGNFEDECQHNYSVYCDFVERRINEYKAEMGKLPVGEHKKAIYEAGAGLLTMSAETSFVWTTNPMALRKFLRERRHPGADAEMQRFGKKLAQLCFKRWPNLFVGKDMDEVRARMGT